MSMLARDIAFANFVNTLVEGGMGLESTSEADHRIANSLMLVSSLLRLQAKELAKHPVVPGADANAALQEAAARIDAVSQLHCMLSAAPQTRTIDSAEYLRRVVDATSRLGADGGAIRVFYDLAEDLPLDAKRMTALGLLASEAVTNSMKHAHPTGVAGEIRVSFRTLSADCVLTIEDDGIGLPDGFNARTGGGLGFRTMRLLAEELDARLTHRSTPLGLRTEVLFAL
jgi:two-component sensor histidine kinase